MGKSGKAEEYMSGQISTEAIKTHLKKHVKDLLFLKNAKVYLRKKYPYFIHR